MLAAIRQQICNARRSNTNNHISRQIYSLGLFLLAESASKENATQCGLGNINSDVDTVSRTARCSSVPLHCVLVEVQVSQKKRASRKSKLPLRQHELSRKGFGSGLDGPSRDVAGSNESRKTDLGKRDFVVVAHWSATR